MFDIEKGDWPDDMRITYHMVKWIIADSAFNYCCNRYNNLIKEANSNLNKKESWKNYAIEYERAYEECISMFSLGVEKLMFETAIILFFSGRSSDEIHYRKIKKILEEEDLGKLLEGLPEKERREFEHDFNLLKLAK